MDKEICKKLKKLVEKDIEKLSAKPELTPAEHCVLKDALTSHAMLEAECEKAEYEDYDNEGSGRRMRSSMTGRYMSSYGMTHPSYGNYDYSYSGHSIQDRAIAILERELAPKTTNDFERQEVSHMIDVIRHS